MANGYQFPYGFQQGNLLTAQRPTATSFYQAAQQGRFGLPKPYEPQSSMLAPTMAAIQSRTTQPLATPTSVAMPTAPLARSRFLQEQQGVPLPRPRPEGMPPSGLDQLRAAQLRMPPKGSPEAAGLSAAGTQLLAAGGWQDRPVTLGQTLASGMQAYTTAKKEAEQLQYDKQRQALADQLALASFQLDVQKAMKPSDPTKPQVETFYDMSTGLPYKAQWNPATQNWDKVGGVKISDFEQTIIDPVTGQVTITKGTGEAPFLEPTVKKNLQNSIQQADKSLTILNTVADLYDPSMSQLGSRFSLALANFQSGLGIPLSQEEQAELNNFLQTSAVASQEFNETLQRMSGAAVTDSESERFKPVLINVGSVDNPFSGDSPAEIQAKLSTQRSVILSTKIRASALLSEDKLITDDMATMYPLSVSVTDANGENKRSFFIIDEYNLAKDDDPELTDAQFMEMWAKTVKTARANEAAKKD